jgi:WD40 repeat protein
MKKPGTLFTDAKMKPPARWIECMHYSPCEKFLAVGSHNSMIYILDVEKKYAVKSSMKAHSAFITSLDWS